MTPIRICSGFSADADISRRSWSPFEVAGIVSQQPGLERDPEDPYADISNRDTVVRRYPNESFCSTLRCIKSRRSHMSELLHYHHSIHSNKHKAKI